jgi:hypothetical protein
MVRIPFSEAGMAIGRIFELELEFNFSPSIPDIDCLFPVGGLTILKAL